MTNDAIERLEELIIGGASGELHGEQVLRALDSFADLVRHMRQVQKDFFKTKARPVLMQAKVLESRVDDWVTEYDEWIRVRGAK